MARQTGPVYYLGTIDHIVYYKLFGEHYYLRTKSTLSRKRFQSDPAFELSRVRSREFGSAAQLASHIYQQLPKLNRGRGFMGKLIGQVHKALQAGKNIESIIQELVQLYGGKQHMVKVSTNHEQIVSNKQAKPTKATPPLSNWVITAKGSFQKYNTTYDSEHNESKAPDD